MADQADLRNIFDKCEDLRLKAIELQAEIDAMSPAERAAFDRRVEENAPELEFLQEIMVKVLERLMPAAEAERWLDEAERQMNAREARRSRGQ